MYQDTESEAALSMARAKGYLEEIVSAREELVATLRSFLRRHPEMLSQTSPHGQLYPVYTGSNTYYADADLNLYTGTIGHFAPLPVHTAERVVQSVSFLRAFYGIH